MAKVKKKKASKLRDWHAREAGWLPPGTELVRRDGTTFSVAAWTRRQRDGQYEHNGYDDGGTRSKQVVVPVHPYPPTRDGAASAMPDGCSVQVSFFRTLGEWSCVVRWNGKRLCATGDSEILVRYEAAKLAKEAMKNG